MFRPSNDLSNEHDLTGGWQGVGVTDSAVSLRRLGILWWVEVDGVEEARALLNEQELIVGDVLEGFEEAGGPADFEEIDLFRFGEAEVDAQIGPGRNRRPEGSPIRCGLDKDGRDRSERKEDAGASR